MSVRLPFAWMVCLRYLREGRMQTLLILAGVTGGVAVIIFLTTLISQLQASIIDKTLGSQAHIVIRPPRAENLTTLPSDSTAAIIQPRAQRLRSVDLFKLPGVAETIDWANALVALDKIALDPQTVNDTLGVLLKYQDDIERIAGEEAQRLTAEAKSAAATN